MATTFVILAGGSGVRFWPRSRKLRPKQLLALATPRTLLAETVARVLPLGGPERVLIITNRVQAEATGAALREAGYPATVGFAPAAGVRVVPEPAARNTAPAIALAAALVQRDDPGGVMVVLAADHHIADAAGFRTVLQTAIGAAGDGSLVTLGIEPTRAETGYGYIEKGAARGDGAFAVTAFREKPDRDTATAYVQSGRYLWNAGIFVAQVAAIRQALHTHMPDLQAAARPLETLPLAELPAAVERLFALAPSQSIDYGVMEKAPNVAVVPAAVGWSDVGSWQATAELLPGDAQGNRVLQGAGVFVDAHDNLVDAAGRTVALVGVHGLAVVVTADAVLVTPLDRSQDVRQVVQALEKAGRDELL